MELFYSIRCRYTIVPYHWTYNLALGLVESWRNLDQIARFAQERRGYGNTDSGFGLEYPTRPDRQGLVRFWRWDWRVQGRIKSRKYHFPEADYLATLAARLRVVGKIEQAEEIAKIMPLPDVKLLPRPDPYDLSNYSVRKIDFLSYQLTHCQRIILEQRDFHLARERILGRIPFTLPDGKWIEYGEQGRLVLHLPRGRTQETTESYYLSVLDASERAYRQWAGKNTQRFDLDPLPKQRS